MISLSFILFSYWMSFWIAAYPDGALRVLEDGKDRSLKLPLEPWFMEKMTALLPKVGIERSLRLLGGGVNRKHTHKHAYLRAHTNTHTNTYTFASSQRLLYIVHLGVVWVQFLWLFGLVSQTCSAMEIVLDRSIFMASLFPLIIGRT